jgi:16S rRNA pseudouridine516 synthase
VSKPAAMRLDRLLANLGYGTRSQVQQMVCAKRVKLDGTPLDDFSARIVVTPDLPQRMSINGEKLDPPPGLVLMMNKPCGATCSHKEAGPRVYELLPPRYRLREPPLSTVGRLDKDTSGLLLITDDGALLHKIISPKSHIAKRYLATLDSPLRGNEAEIFASGGLVLDGEDKPLLPATLEALSPTSAYVTVTEGRYHQVRRMFAAVANRVLALHRDRIGGLALPDDLATGQFVALEVGSAAAIFESST